MAFSSTSARVKICNRQFSYTATSNGTLLTVTTSAPHFLVTGDLVNLLSASSQQQLIQVAITVTGASTFTIALTDQYFALNGYVITDIFRNGNSGYYIYTLPNHPGNGAVIQSFVTGAFGASYTPATSLDGVHWTPMSAVTHLGNDVMSAIVPNNWVYLGINITSITAGAALEVMYA